MASWPSGVSAITLFVEDLGAVREFYERVFGSEPVFSDEDSAAFGFGSTIVNLLRVSAGPELIEPATIARLDAGARMVLTITVDDVDARCAELGELGVRLLNGPIDRSWGVRTAAFQDPAGNVWEIAQPIPGS